MRHLPIFLAAALLGIAAVPALADPGTTPAATPINVSGEGLKKTALFKKWKVSLETPAKVGKATSGLFCTGPIDLPYSANYDRYLMGRINKVFKEKAAALGYPKYEASDSTFGDSTISSPDLSVGFTLKDLNHTACVNRREVSGSGRIALKVEVFSNKLQKVVYSGIVDGAFASESAVDTDVFDDGMIGSALDKMFADQKYVNAFRDDAAAAAVAATPGKLIVVKNGVPSGDDLNKDAKSVLGAVVTIETAGGSGSGFYIGRDGYIVTNQHVVGSAKYVKVRLSGGYSVPGEVVREDAARDVALVKTDIEPPLALCVRTTPARVGEEVFAVGSPFGAQLSSTVTRGILSGERTLADHKFMQSDVAINPGNSGGPLFDAKGALIAVADLKRNNASGIAMFIPIGEALEKLGLSLQ